MKLTEHDIAYLKEELQEDDASIVQIHQSTIRIEQSADEYTQKPTRLTHKEARQLLGDKRYLGAIDRCVFHRDASCSIEGSNKVLYFERLIRRAK